MHPSLLIRCHPPDQHHSPHQPTLLLNELTETVSNKRTLVSIQIDPKTPLGRSGLTFCGSTPQVRTQSPLLIVC